MHSKQHGKIYLVFTWMHGFHRLISVYVIVVGKVGGKSSQGRTSEIYTYDRLFWKRENRPASEKTSIPTSILNLNVNSRRNNFLQMKHLTALYLKKIFELKIMHMHNAYGKILRYRILDSTMIYMC